MNSMKSKALAALASCALISPSVLGHNLEIDFLVGGDDNPNKLSETFEVDAAFFGRARIELSHMPTRTGFYYDLEAGSSVYQADDEAISDPAYAEKTKGKAQLGFKWRPRFDFGRARFKFELFGQSQDSTYIDHSTGDIARFVRLTPAIDEPIEDRFDYTISGFYTSGDVPISDQAFFVYDLKLIDKAYENYLDFEIEGLDNLDYQQYELDIGFEKWIWPRANLITMVGAGTRLYTDRRSRDEDGDEVIDSDLEFTYFEIENAIEYKVTDRFKWKLGFDVDQRKDNEDGYYDTTKARVFTRLQFNNPGYVKIVFSASYSKRTFDNIEDAEDIEEEDFREREGYRAKLEMVRNMRQWTRIPFDVIIGMEARSYENSNSNFTYDRNQFYFGVRWRPFDI